MDALSQRTFFVVRLTLRFASMSEVQQSSPDLLLGHVRRSKELHAQGVLLMAGAFADRPGEFLQTMAVLATREACEEYLAGDPFVQRGDATRQEILEWRNMFYEVTASR